MQMKLFNKSFWRIRKKRKSYAVTAKPTMISDGRKTPIKMAGYLEKKSKMRVVCRWKKLWFVLEGRLLLYYKSQIEYLSLSPCRGTVNLGLAASVIPGKSNEIIVSTRSTTVSLRALNRGDHDIWLQALMDAMCMPNSNHIGSCKKPVHHFRYSTGGLDHSEIKADVACSGVDNNGVESLSPLYMKTSSTVNVSVSPEVVKVKSKHEKEPESVVAEQIPPAEIQRKSSVQNGVNRIPNNNNSNHENRVDRLGKKFSKVAVSDTSIPGKFKLTSNENVKSSLRRSASVEEEVNRYTENIYESLKDVNKFESNIINKQTRKFVNRVNRSDSDCLMMIAREKNKNIQSPFRSEQRIITSGNSPLPVYDRYGESFYFRRADKQTADDRDKLWKLKQKYNDIAAQNYMKEIKSDTDLTVRRHRCITEQSKHYGALYRPTALTKRNSESYDFSNLQEIVKDKTRAPLPIPINAASLRQPKPTRSNSILRNFSRLKQNDKINGTNNDLTKRNSVKKKSLSFLRKIWKKKEDSSKWEIDSFSSELNIQFQEMQGPSSDFDNISDFSVNDASLAYDVPLPEPPPDYDQVQVIDDEFERVDEPPALPPRLHHIRATSPPHDRPINNKPIVNLEQPLEPPALPVKMRKLPQQNNHVTLDFLFYENTDPGLTYLFQEEEYLISQENGKENNNINNNNNNNNDNNNDQELGEMLLKLNEINNAPLTGFHLYENGHNSFGVRKGQHEEDPDYDVPRPHISLLSNLRKESCAMDSLPATNFFNQYEDSLDVNTSRDRFEEFTMAPDSLECDPWSLSNEADVRSENWSLSCDLHDPTIKSTMSDHNLNHDSLYNTDSLNPPTISHRLNDYIHLQQNGFIQLHT